MDSIINFTNYSISAAAATWEGCREYQEDTVWLSDTDRAATAGSFMAVLSDGMGGMDDGQDASKLIVSTYVNCHITKGGESLECFLNTANMALRDAKEAGTIRDGAGATLIAARVTENGIEWQSVGDSLLYLQRNGIVKKLNTAHTWGQKLASEVASGQITEEEAQAQAETKPSNALYEAVCGDFIKNHDEETDECRPGDRYIMASDGFTPLTDTAWEELLNSTGIRQASPAEACEVLLMKLKKMNTEQQDNASIIIFDVVEKQENTAIPPTPSEIEAKMAVSNGVEKAIEVQLIGDRSSQQDSVGHWCSDEAILAVVADGAGGHVGGAQASQTAVATMERYWQDKLAAGVSPDEAAEILTQAVQQAHTDIIQNAGGNAALSGKSAFVAVYLHDGYYTCVNVGDCRAYVTSQGQWKQLSIDDSLLRILVDKGEVTPIEAKNHPDQNILTQALGTESKIKPHVSHGTYSEQDSFLLCCDGLWNQLPEEQWPLANWEATSTTQYKNVLSIMANKAVIAANGSSDNVSAVWICATTPDKAAFHPPLAPLRQELSVNKLRTPVAKLALIAIGLLIISVLLILCSTPDKQALPPIDKNTLPADAQVKSAASQNGATPATAAPKDEPNSSMLSPTNASTPGEVETRKTPTPIRTNANDGGDTHTSDTTGDYSGNDTMFDSTHTTDATGDYSENDTMFDGTQSPEDCTNSLPSATTPEEPENKSKRDASPVKVDNIDNYGCTTTISSISYVSSNYYITSVSFRYDNGCSYRDNIRRRARIQREGANYSLQSDNTAEEAIFNLLFRPILLNE